MFETLIISGRRHSLSGVTANGNAVIASTSYEMAFHNASANPANSVARHSIGVPAHRLENVMLGRWEHAIRGRGAEELNRLNTQAGIILLHTVR